MTQIIPHLILIGYCVIALFPIVLIVINSFKSRAGIFGAPYALPTAETFSLIGYETVFSRANFGTNFLNSLIVTGASLLLILLIGSMAAFALSEYKFRGNTLIGLYLAIGIMIPIRLGTVGILRIDGVAGSGQHAARPDPGLHRAGAAADHLHSHEFHAAGARGTEGRRPHRRRQRIPHLPHGRCRWSARPSARSASSR